MYDMASTQLKTLKPKHEAIVDYILANPDTTVTALAGAFSVSVPWMSIIMHSEVFKECLAKKSQEVFDQVVIPTRAKMTSVADAAYQKLNERIPFIEDPKTLLDIADKTAHRLGYAPTRGPVPAEGNTVNNYQQNNYYAVDKGTLHEAREKMVNNNKKEESIVPALPEPATQ